jgi:hypothetical protein
MFRHRDRMIKIMVILLAVALVVSFTLPLILAGR